MDTKTKILHELWKINKSIAKKLKICPVRGSNCGTELFVSSFPLLFRRSLKLSLNTLLLFLNSKLLRA